MNQELNQLPQDAVATYSLSSEERFVDKKYANLRSDIIEITHDKLENVLLKFYQKHALRTVWLNPLSIGISVALTLSTAEFKTKTMGLDGTTWQSIFVITLVCSIIWLLINLARLGFCWRETSIEFLIDRIKNKGKE